MSPKHRRPASMRRIEMISFRATLGESMMITEMAEEAGMSRSEFCMAACYAMGGREPERLKKLKADRIFLANNPVEDVDNGSNENK